MDQSIAETNIAFYTKLLEDDLRSEDRAIVEKLILEERLKLVREDQQMIPAKLREECRRVIEVVRASTDLAEKQRLAERACELAQIAEVIERNGGPSLPG